MIRIFIIATVLLCISCKEDKPLVPTTLDNIALIPKPNNVIELPYGFLFTNETTIEAEASKEVQAIASQFAQDVKDGFTSIPTGTNLSVHKNVVRFVIVSEDSIPSPEGYTLNVNKDLVSITASKPQGLFRGVQTLKQLVPTHLIAGEKTDSLVIPGVVIQDAPAYSHRGMMLDVARHFFTVSQVKRLLDQLALYKINKLHLHLTDDQGWRIEIKSWPKLTEVGGKSAVGGDQGGFFSQEDYSEIVAYAQSKFITIIPEIDMPGHTNAALSSYPELNCNGIATKPYTGMRVGFSSLCVDKELTYSFLDDVIGEIAQLTPGKYIHLGGDESHSTTLKDYNSFLKKAFAIVKKYNKEVMGWEDIQSAGVDSTFVLQHWTSEKITKQGIAQGARVILSPATHAYLDIKYTRDSKIGLTWAGTVEVDSAYVWHPSNIFPEADPNQIIGIESPLWSETIRTTDDLEFLAFPRVIGHAELGWTRRSGTTTSWRDYKKRLAQHYKILDELGINYYESPLIPTKAP